MDIVCPSLFSSIFLNEPLESGPPEKKRIFEIFDRELTVYAPGLYEFPSTKIWIDLTLANDISASTPTK